ncbi:MAG: hypothetical protein KAT05_01465, partial [Spirochaetes bacterium]|nr:hypothetical protein [Spirochaetota bacterium]
KGDAITYDYYVRLGIPKFLYNPHHVAFDWLGQKMYKMLKNNGYTGSTMMILQLRNLLISSIGLSIFFFLFYKISKKYILSIFIILLIAFSCAFWIYSQINDTAIIHSILVGLLFFAVIYFPQVKNKYLYSCLLGIFHAITIFFHQSDFVFIFVISFIILFANHFLLNKENALTYSKIDFIKRNNLIMQKKPFLKVYNIRYFFIYFITLIVIITITYYYIGIVLIGLTFNQGNAVAFNQFSDSTYFFNWLVLYTKIDYWGKGYEGNTLMKALHGISTYFYHPQLFQGQQIGFDIKNIFSPNSILPNFLYFFVSSILIFTILFIVPLYKKYKYILISNLIFLIVYVAFACWWEPDYREFWVAPMLSFWILAFLILNFIIEKLKMLQPLPNIFLYSYLFLLIFLLFYFNFTGFLYPNASIQFRKFEIMKGK